MLTVIRHGDFRPVEIPIQPTRIDHAPQDAPKQQPIESRQYTTDSLPQLTYKTQHGVAPEEGRVLNKPSLTHGATLFQTTIPILVAAKPR
jgi:hypothetical protein